MRLLRLLIAVSLLAMASVIAPGAVADRSAGAASSPFDPTVGGVATALGEEHRLAALDGGTSDPFARDDLAGGSKLDQHEKVIPMGRSISARSAASAALAGSVLLSGVGGLEGASAQFDPWVEPVAEFDFPDPDLVIDDDGRWFAFATGGDWFWSGPGINIRLAISDDQGATWTLVGDVLPEAGRWASDFLTWAPSLLRVGDTWVMYYSAPELESGRQCIGRAISSTLWGPFVDPHPAPIVCPLDLGGSIDPEAFRDADDELWLMWKNDGNAIGTTSFIWSQQLTADGMELTGSPSRLLGVTAGWEQPIIEHPAVIVGDSLWVLYSAGPGYMDTGYSTGVARCTLPRGPCSKSPTPLLSSEVANGLIGPGGAHAATDPSGSRWMLHHGWNPDRTERWLYRRPVVIGADVVVSGPLSVTVGPPGTREFTDVPPSAFYAAAVEWAKGLGVTKGTSPTTFSPERPVTRGEFAAFVHRWMGSPAPVGPSGFLDVPADAFFANAVAWMAQSGVTKGTSPTTFSPERPVTRGEIAAFLHRSMGSPAPVGPSGFLDVPVDAFFADAVAWMAQSGVTKGTSPTTFSPDRHSTRAEAVTFLFRLSDW